MKRAKAQATLDALGPPQEQKDVPIAVKWTPSGEDAKIQTGDYMTSQQQGLMAPKVPRKQQKRRRKMRRLRRSPRAGVEGRMKELVRLIDDVREK